MYINFWYPIARSSEVTADKPLKVTLLTLPFVAFRDTAGQAHVLADTCVHRGGSLGAGRIKDGCVVCPYHGWEFAGSGKCAHVPSLGRDAKLPARAKVDSYPVQEKYGIVFAFLGDLPEEERPPIHDIAEYGQAPWKAFLYVLDLKAYYERSMENGLDPIHNEFVHPLQGAPMLSPERQRQPPSVLAWLIKTVGTRTNGNPTAMTKKRIASLRMKFPAITTPTVSAALRAVNSQPCQVLGVAP